MSCLLDLAGQPGTPITQLYRDHQIADLEAHSDVLRWSCASVCSVREAPMPAPRTRCACAASQHTCVTHRVQTARCTAAWCGRPVAAPATPDARPDQARGRHMEHLDPNRGASPATCASVSGRGPAAAAPRHVVSSSPPSTASGRCSRPPPCPRWVPVGSQQGGVPHVTRAGQQRSSRRDGSVCGRAPRWGARITAPRVDDKRVG